MRTLNLSEAIQLGLCLEPPGSPLSYKGCAIGLAMAAMGIPRKNRTASKAKELWPWLGHQSRKSLFGLLATTHMQDISDWYFNVRLGRMTMAELVRRIRAAEPPQCKTASTGSFGEPANYGPAGSVDSRPPLTA
jgi:hypothetical protein